MVSDQTEFSRRHLIERSQPTCTPAVRRAVVVPSSQAHECRTKQHSQPTSPTTTPVQSEASGPSSDRPDAPSRLTRTDTDAHTPTPMSGESSVRRLPKGGATTKAQVRFAKKRRERCSRAQVVRIGYTGNDPSAGSPTETLLRLLLPLNDKVWTASRGIAAGEPAALPQSGGLTGSFNR